MDQTDPVPPVRARRPWFVVVAILATALVAGLIISNLNIAGAQTPSPSPGAKNKLHGFGHGFGHRFGFGDALHGQFTAPAPNGGFQTILVQRGTVQSVSGSSITVKSDDGYTHTYSVDNNTLVAAGDNGIADVAKGDDVRILAVGDAAKQLFDVTKVQSLRQKYWAPKQHKDETPEPGGSATASNTSANV